MGIGEDTGGSIRLPASFNNLVGVRVMPGLISRTGLSPLVVFQDTAGPMGRTVLDTAHGLDAVIGLIASIQNRFGASVMKPRSTGSCAGRA